MLTYLLVIVFWYLTPIRVLTWSVKQQLYQSALLVVVVVFIWFHMVFIWFLYVLGWASYDLIWFYIS